MNVEEIRKDFPILLDKDNKEHKPIIYFDNACMSLKPECVISEMVRYYHEFSACGGRSIHYLSRRVSEEVEKAREEIASFFGCKDAREFVFVKNTTEAINLVSYGLNLKKGDVVLTSDKEHNSNLVPWQMLSKKKGIEHRIVPTREDNTLDIEVFEKFVKGASLVSIVHTSNLDGYTMPAKEIIEIAHEHDALVLLDGAQSAPHMQIDLKKLDVDLFAFSLHKMLGPTGVGCLYGKYEILEKLEPFITGGDTVDDTTYTSAQFKDVPSKFEAGLGNYAGYVGAGEAIRYLKKVGMKNIREHEIKLNRIIDRELREFDGLKIIGPEDASLRGGITSFVVEDTDSHDIALILSEGSRIFVRSGAFCVHSWFNSRRVPPALRVSLYIYNTKEECKIFIEKLREVLGLL
jgi:cysteine desulfurase/selenocysteine lyase